jgi:hypothetical protein
MKYAAERRELAALRQKLAAALPQVRLIIASNDPGEHVTDANGERRYVPPLTEDEISYHDAAGAYVRLQRGERESLQGFYDRATEQASRDGATGNLLTGDVDYPAPWERGEPGDAVSDEDDSGGHVTALPKATHAAVEQFPSCWNGTSLSDAPDNPANHEGERAE